MTETTDTASLKKQIETAADIIRDLTDRLEAERQRSAGSEEELHKALHREKAAERKLMAAQEEIAALKTDIESYVGIGSELATELAAMKGDQVPVSDKRTMKSVTQAECLAWAYKFVGECKAVEALKGDQVPVTWPNMPFSFEELEQMHGATFANGYVRGWARKCESVTMKGPLFTAPQKPVVLPEINEDLVEIIGRPNFTCSGLADLLRRNGADIKRKSENEQAYVIHWLLVIYLKHGIEWRATAESELKSLAAKASAGGIVKDVE